MKAKPNLVMLSLALSEIVKPVANCLWYMVLYVMFSNTTISSTNPCQNQSKPVKTRQAQQYTLKVRWKPVKFILKSFKIILKSIKLILKPVKLILKLVKLILKSICFICNLRTPIKPIMLNQTRFYIVKPINNLFPKPINILQLFPSCQENEIQSYENAAGS